MSCLRLPSSGPNGSAFSIIVTSMCDFALERGSFMSNMDFFSRKGYWPDWNRIVSPSTSLRICCNRLERKPIFRLLLGGGEAKFTGEQAREFLGDDDSSTISAATDKRSSRRFADSFTPLDPLRKEGTKLEAPLMREI